MIPFRRIESRKIYKTSSNEKSHIQCASLNKSSLQSFASGHDNGDIKIWEIGKNESICSFESNLSITCVTFNNNENDNTNNNNLLVSGNIGGGIKLYDLNENKLVRNYGEHRSEIKDINFFHFNNGTQLIISSSSDSNVKIWDIRNKTSIKTFKGHTNAVNCIDFSPDGSWIVSADCIGHTKLWDISTTKCFHEFHDKQSINDVLFHPEELVLATAVGKIVRFWDLETMKHISRTSKVTTPIKKILFPQNNDESNQYIISASNQSLRIWQYEPLPVYCTNNISVYWNNTIDDMQHIKGYNDLICLELDKNNVIVWLTDIGQIFGNNITIKKEQQKIDEYYKPKTVTKIQYKDEYDDDEFEEIDDEDIPSDNINETTKGGINLDESFEIKENIQNTSKMITVPDVLKNMPQEMWSKSFVEAVDIVRKQRKKQGKLKCMLQKIEPQTSNNKVEPPNEVFAANNELKRSPNRNEGYDNKITNKDNNIFNCSPKINVNRNLKFAQFIPKHLIDFDERELIKIKRSMMIEHIPILRMLSTRLRYLRQLKSLWKKNKINEFIQILKQIQNDIECGNNILFISFMECILKDINKKSFSFRFCYLLLSAIDFKQMDINNEITVIIILKYINFILETFSSLIINTLKIEIINEKDLNMVDRIKYCQNGYDLFTKHIKPIIHKLHNDTKQNNDKSNIKIDELCTKIITSLELLN